LIAPKKSFGQHFLADANIARIIARAAVPDDEVGRADVVEIGAGTGALTEHLAARARRLIAIERDRDLVPLLRARFPAIEVLEADAQTAPLNADVICGNLPYQITGRILRRATEVSMRRAVFMVQLEVADRILAAPGTKTYGALTVFVRAAMHAERVRTVPRTAFRPPPKVTSAIVRLVPRADRIVETPVFRELVKRAFEARRKTLRNAWSGLVDEALAERAGISLRARGETLTPEDFARIAAALTTC